MSGSGHPLRWWVAVAVALAGCGPTVSLDDPRDPSDSSTSGLATDGVGSSRGRSTSASASTAASSGTAGTSVGTVDTAEEGPPSPRLDVPSPILDLPAPPSDQPMYAACSGDEQCQPGLECVVLAYGEDVQYSICTAPCVEPTADCEPAPRGWAPTCALHVRDGQSDVCAIACSGRLECPMEQVCSELFGPGGRLQTVCVP